MSTPEWLDHRELDDAPLPEPPEAAPADLVGGAVKALLEAVDTVRGCLLEEETRTAWEALISPGGSREDDILERVIFEIALDLLRTTSFGRALMGARREGGPP